MTKSRIERTVKQNVMEFMAAQAAGKPIVVKPNGAHRAKAKLAAPSKALAKVEPSAPRPFKLPAGLMGRAKAKGQRGTTRPADQHPFKPYEPMPGVVPKDHKIAMDEAMTSAVAWASGAVFNGMFWEGQAFLGYPYLAELAQRPEYRVISETIATEMTRKWIEFEATGDDAEDKTEKIADLKEALDRLKVREAFRELIEQDGFFGRSHLYIDTGDTDNRAELLTPIGDGSNDISQKKIEKGKLKRLKTIEAVWCYPANYNANDPMKQDWYNPQTWFVQGKEVHVSRLLTFVGREVPDLLKPAYAFGGLSLSQMAKPYVDNWLQTRQSVSDLISAFSVMILSTDLNTLLGPDSGNELFDRVDLFNNLRDNRGLMLVNKTTEEMSNVTTPLSGLDLLQAQAQEHMASVSRIPLVKLLGIQPAGLNASAEGEIRTFYDSVEAAQEKFLREKLTRVINFVQLSEFGAVDPEITYRFVPLWSLDAKQEADVEKTKADTDGVYIDKGVIGPEEVRTRLAGDSASPYHGIDPADVPEPPDQGEGGEGGETIEPDPTGGGPTESGGGANDAVIPFGGALDDFLEAEHPRGQPGNAGQFGPGGSGGGKQVSHAPQFGQQHGHFTAPAAAKGFTPSKARASNIGAPIDVAKLKKVGKQMGSNPGGVYEDDAGKKFYVKQGKSKEHVRNEMIAAKLYDLAGTPTLEYRPVEGGAHVATEIEKLDKDNASKLSPAERSEAARDFAVHAWLGNWDAVGLGGDNLGTIKGVPTALDLGGALEYRAQGAPKGKAFGDKVTELTTLRDPSINKDAAGVFGGMTPADMRESARYVTSIRDDKIRKAVEGLGGSAALAEKLIARKNDIAEQAKTFGAEGDPKKPTSTVVIPAGGKLPVKALNGVAFEAYEPPKDWAAVDGQMADLDEPRFEVPEHKKPSTGVIIKEPDGRVWIVQPRGGYGGYEGTFPKGGLEKGLSPQANAIKEAYEESGLKVRITGFAGDHAGDMTMTRFYHAVRETGDPSQHDDETDGVVLAPPEKAAGFLNRERDRKIALAGDALFDDRDLDTQHWIDETRRREPDVRVTIVEQTRLPVRFEPDEDDDESAEDEAPFEEAKHPRAPDGEFTSAGGGGEAEMTPALISSFLSKPAIAGGNYRRQLVKMIKHVGEDTVEGATLKGKLIDSWTKTHANAIKKGDVGTAEKIANKIKKLNGGTTPSAVAEATHKAKQAEKLTPVEQQAMTKTLAKEPAPAFPAPTQQEIDKAKKNVKLQLQYVPGAPQTPAAQKLVDAFNQKYEGKDLAGNQPALIQKVNDFKKLQADMVPLMSAEQKAAAAKAAEAAANQKASQAAQAAAAEQAKKAEAAKLEKAKAKLKTVMTELGLDNEADASAVQGLMQMMGTKDPADFIKKFKNLASAHGEHGVTAFELSMLRAYTGSAYGAVNKALRSGSWSLQQHMYVNTVNKALKKLPVYAGATKRGTTLPSEVQALYVPGHVVEERAFTSTSKTNPWSGNTQYVISGKSGRDVQSISNHKGEAEVLYPARTFFRVEKVDGKPGGQMTVHLKEVESW